MLALTSGKGHRDCSGLSRRDVLRAGVLGASGWTLPWLLRMRALAASSGLAFEERSVVLLFLAGGASHIETFNPNMDAPSPYRSVTGEVSTTLPGVTFGGTFPLLARHARRMAVVRSFRHPVGSHPEAIVHVLSGGTRRSARAAGGFSIGSAYARLRGANDPRTGLPSYALLTAQETDPQYRTEKRRVEDGSSPGILGPVYAPFDPAGGGHVVENMELRLGAERLADRVALRRELDRLRREIDARGVMDAVDRYEEQALDVVLRGASQAFDISREDPRTIERYDTSMFRVGNVKHRPELVRRSTLGEQMLMARRLSEAGCGFVTVENAGWDNHADGNNPGILDGIEMLGRPLDKAVSAFLEDVESRGLSERILLVITGDFGRTPKINSRGGRDHWPNLCTLALAGGGLRMGQVIGRAERKNDHPASDPVSPANLMATVLHTLVDLGQARVARGLPRELLDVAERAEPIRELV